MFSRTKTKGTSTGANVTKLFTPVIYEFLYRARVFVRLGWKKTFELFTKINKLRT
jgi:hypothetical protein